MMIDGLRRGMVTATQARDLHNLEFPVVLRQLFQASSQVVATVDFADDVATDRNLPGGWRSAAELRIEADESLDAISGDTSFQGEFFELLVCEVAVLALQIQQFAQQLQRDSSRGGWVRLSLWVTAWRP